MASDSPVGIVAQAPDLRFAFMPHHITPRREPTTRSFVLKENKQGTYLMTSQLNNPKLDEHPGSNTEKDPANWVSGDDPMTGAQSSYLTTLSEEAGEEPPAADLSKAEASKRIDALKTELGLQ